VPIRPSGCFTCPRRDRLAAVLAGALFLLPLAGAQSGCGALVLVGGAGTSAIAFATGELRSTEETPLATLDEACRSAIEALGYEKIETQRKADRVRWRARKAGGDPVDIRLQAESPELTELRIRIGVFGDETRSRLLLEQIHQSL
jgi:hypothetical protein